MKARPIQSVDERGELRSREPHHAVADRRPAKRALLEPLPKQHQARTRPRPKSSADPLFSSGRRKSSPRRDRVEAPRAPGRRGCRRRVGSPPASSQPAPARPAGTAIMSPPSRRAAPRSASPRQSRRDANRRRADHDLDRPRLRRPRGSAQPAPPGSAGPPRQSPAQRPPAHIALVVSRLSPGPPSRLAPPAEQLLRRQPVTPRDSRDLLAALIAFGENLRLLLRRPRTASAGAGKYLQPAHRLRLRFVQKLSVRHVSNPLEFSDADIRRSAPGA